MGVEHTDGWAALIEQHEGEMIGLRDRIDVIARDDLGRDAFEARYLEPKVPLILTGCMESWQCYREWTRYETKSIHLEALSSVFGHIEVPVVNMRSGEKSTLPMEEYCSEKFWDSGQWREDKDKLYVKDFHFCIEAPSTRNAYTIPEYFEDDWLNAWFDGDDDGVAKTFGKDFKKSDYKFLYLGPQGSSTPVHTDVVRSHSWSAQIAGTKQWKLVHPTYAPNIEDHNGICSCENLAHTHDDDNIMTVIQYPGEIIFVPSGWYHEVANIENSLSINHNWIDSSSLDASWQYLTKEYEIASSMIEDCRAFTSAEEFNGLVARNVLHNCGFHRQSFRTMVTFVLDRAPCSSVHVTRRRLQYGKEFLQAHTSSVLSD